MGCCETLMRMILVVVNVVVLAAGLVLLVVGGIFYTKQYDYFPDFEKYSTNVHAMLIPMLVLGGILLVVGLIGCIGACSRKSGFLNIYFIIIMVVVVLQLAIGIYCYVKKDDVKQVAKDGFTELLAKYLDKFVLKKAAAEITDAEVLAVNSAQSVIGCCGVTDGPSYWKQNDNLLLPPGCCTGWMGESMNDTDALVDCATIKNSTAYQEGCLKKVDSVLNQFGIVIIVIMVAIIIFELVCMCAACYSKKNDMMEYA